MILTKIKHFLRNSRQYLFCSDNQVSIKDYNYFIFLDSKVPNIIEQIYPFFQKGFFDKDRVVIVYRHHFENIKAIRKAIDKLSLNSYCFINLRDIPSIENGIWFYTHNSMTNLAVINKNVYSKHIWMGHGDSEKVSSYKKIIRIYDYCLVAGENSIERFYKHNIFREEESYRFIRTGKANLCSVIPNNLIDSEQRAILFVPTWEGPMREENYSTLHLYKETIELINSFSIDLDCDKIVIKFHPNTGIRDTDYLGYSFEIIRELLLKNKKITLVSDNSSWIYTHFYKVFGDKIAYTETLYDLKSHSFAVAITNISAMATMTYAEDINTIVLYDSRVEIQKRIDILFTKKVALDKIDSKSKDFLDIKMQKNSKIISYEDGWEELSDSEIFNKFVEKFL